MVKSVFFFGCHSWKQLSIVNKFHGRTSTPQSLTLTLVLLPQKAVLPKCLWSSYYAAIVNFKDWALLYHQDHQCCPNSFLPLVTLVQYAVVYDKQTKRLLEKTSQKKLPKFVEGASQIDLDTF